ncbi:hypothetical protein [Luteibacter sp. 3190]|uniref:hypothetical protein n=1 Tax=Luteibacter sp. 3190 TaxID=2817736 RepID=UPI002860D50E|nr:hypothetical protein [Luteibacter sp. 3190]MDR6936852.1 hypothetical protein [Luteibacter sp. 3190]
MAWQFQKNVLGTRHVDVAKVGSWIIAMAMVLFVGRYAYRAGISVVAADSWDFVRGFVSHYNAGTLTAEDFFGKRPLGYDHSQPIQRAVLWLHMTLFRMDFGVEGAIGCLFAAAFAGFCSHLVTKEIEVRSPGSTGSALFRVALFASVFSLSARSVFDWSLVTLAFADILGATLLVTYAYHCLRGLRFLRLAIATFIACALMDTVAIIAVVALLILLPLATVPTGNRNYRNRLLAAAALIFPTIVYKLGYAVLFPVEKVAIPQPDAGPITYFLHAWPDAWKALVVPLAGAVASTSRLSTSATGVVWPILFAIALPMLLLSVWFWMSAFRYRARASAFTAAGVMLIAYGSIAGVLLIRVPMYGFDYLLQPRYTMFYNLQLVALLMMASCDWNSVRSLGKSLISAGAIVTLGLWLAYARLTAREEGSVRAYNQQLADQIYAIWRDPNSTPDPCSPNIFPCSWTPATRVDVMKTLEDGPWNVFVPSFRHRHGIHWSDDPHQPVSR